MQCFSNAILDYSTDFKRTQVRLLDKFLLIGGVDILGKI